MGWHSSSDPRRREIDIRRNEAEGYKQDMSEAEKRRNMEHKEINSEVNEKFFLNIIQISF